MVQKLIIFLTLTTFLSIPSTSFALRCGSKLVDIGDLKINVQLACGEPFSKETIGYVDQVRYTDQKTKNDNKEIVERIRVMSIEEWIIKDKNNYYSLIFEGSTLKSIKWAVRE